MWWLCTVWVDGGEHYRCVAKSGSEYYAQKLARQYFKSEGEFVVDVEAEMFDTFAHGDVSDYEIVTWSVCWFSL